MPDINYSHPAGGDYNLKTSGAGGGMPGIDDMMAFYKEMAARRMAQQADDRARRMTREDYSFQQLKDAVQAAKSPLAGRDLNADRMQAARDRDELIQMQARQGQAPMKARPDLGNTSAGVFEMDPGAMNAYQRQAFLPQESKFTGGPTGMERAGAQRLSDEAELEKARELIALRSRAGGGIAGDDRADWPGWRRGGLG